MKREFSLNDIKTTFQNLNQQIKEKRTIQAMKEFSNLDLESNDELVNWLGKWGTCQNKIFNDNVLLPNLSNRGFGTMDEYFKVYPDDYSPAFTIQDYIEMNENKNQIAQYIISMAMTDLKEIGFINEHLSEIVEIYNKKFNKNKQKKK